MLGRGAATFGTETGGVVDRNSIALNAPIGPQENWTVPHRRSTKLGVKAKQSFREFQAARRTIEGYAAMHMIRNGQARWVSDADVRQQNQFVDQLFDLAA